MNGPEIATITIRRVPFDGGYSFECERAGVPLEDHPLHDGTMTRTHGWIATGLHRIGALLDEIEQAGP